MRIEDVTAYERKKLAGILAELKKIHWELQFKLCELDDCCPLRDRISKVLAQLIRVENRAARRAETLRNNK